MITRIENRIEEVKRWDPKQRTLNVAKFEYAINHRVLPPAKFSRDAVGVAEFYATVPEAAKATGGEMPYALVILPDGTVEQALPLSDFGPHAAAFNLRGCGIGWIGDFRAHLPTDWQWESGFELNTLFAGMGLKIRGHTEMGVTASRDPKKDCPGRLLDMRMLRSSIDWRLKQDDGLVGAPAIARLEELGLVF